MPTSAPSATTPWSTSTTSRTPCPATHSSSGPGRAPTWHTNARHDLSSTSFRRTCTGGTLPQVSWIVAPEAFSEHPNWPANFGAWYVSKVLDALTSDPDVWAKTALFLTYDENDGFFDHQVPPYPNVGGLNGASTVSLTHELYSGPRRHPRPLRARHPGPDDRDLPLEHGRLGVLRGLRPHLDHPVHGAAVRRTRAEHHALAPGRLRRPHVGLRLLDDARRGRLPCRTPTRSSRPTTCVTPPSPRARRRQQHVPKQEAGVRPSRAARVPPPRRPPRVRDQRWTSRSPTAAGSGRSSRRGRTTWRARRSATPSGPAARLRPTLKAHGHYDVSFHGPNGFFRRFAGSTTDAAARGPGARAQDGHLVLTPAQPLRPRPPSVQVADAYGRDRTVQGAPKRTRKQVASRWPRPTAGTTCGSRSRTIRTSCAPWPGGSRTGATAPAIRSSAGDHAGVSAGLTCRCE